MKNQDREAPYEAPEIMELDKVEKVTLGQPSRQYFDNCCCTKSTPIELS